MIHNNNLKYIHVSHIDLYYKEYGKGTNYIVFLHGWGQSHSFWENLGEKLSNKYHILILDLPGFGLSKEPPTIWNLEDYAQFVYQFTKKKHIAKPIIIGHSFGGRIASVYATKFPIRKLVLYSNGGLPIISLKMRINKHFIVPLVKHLFPNLLYRSHGIIYRPKHYKNASIVNRERSKRMLDIYTQPFQNLEEVFKSISVNTLIIVGTKDFIASPRIGRTIQELIKKSTLVEIKNATHFAHFEQSEVFYNALTKFLNQD